MTQTKGEFKPQHKASLPQTRFQ